MRIISRRATAVAFVSLSVLLLAAASSAFDPGSAARPHARANQMHAVRQAARLAVAELRGEGSSAVLRWSPRTALWGGHTPANWWQSALTLDGLIRFVERSGRDQAWLQPMLVRIYERNVFRRHSRARRDFANEFMDDTAWWGQTWAQAAAFELDFRHDLPDARRFLAVAEHDARYIARHPRPCGGIEWELGTGTDTVTNSEFVTLVAELAALRHASGPLRSPGLAARWQRDALRTLRWLERSGLVNVAAGTLRDRPGRNCHRFVGGPMTYTEGEMADALVRVGQATGRRAYIRQAARFLRYTLSPGSGLLYHGILQEHCEATAAQCANLFNRGDMPAYKGVFINAIVDWEQATGSHTFDGFLRRQAAAILADSVRGPDGSAGRCDTPDDCRLTFAWRPARLVPSRYQRHALNISVASQISAIDALSAALPAPADVQPPTL